MILSDLAVRRPVLSLVLSLVVLTLGVVGMTRLAMRELPDIDSPRVSISTAYPGAAASVAETRVTQLIENEISGIDGIRTISSSTSDGRSSIDVEFVLGRDLDAAANDVRDRVGRVLGEVGRQGRHGNLTHQVQAAPEAGPRAVQFSDPAHQPHGEDATEKGIQKGQGDEAGGAPQAQGRGPDLTLHRQVDVRQDL